MGATDKIAFMGKNHPNRGAGRFNNAGANPTPKQISALRESAGLTQTEFGALAYKNWRTVQHYEADVGTPEHRRMPPDTWELLQLKVKARDLVKRGRIAPQALKELGLQLPSED